MKRLMLILATLLLSTPVWAQERTVDLIGFANWVDPTGDHVLEGPQSVDDVNLNFDSDQGFGIGINVFWSERISTEFEGSVVEPDLTLQSAAPGFPATGKVKMIPITAVLQYHFNPRGRFDPYVGAGAAYVLFDKVSDAGDLGNIDRIDFDDDAGLVVNAGTTIDLTPSIALYLDGKYVPVKSNAKATFVTGPSSEAKVDVNPLMLAAGISFQF